MGGDEAGTGDATIDPRGAVHVRDLELDLRQTREKLQATIEELRTSNDELQSLNVELVTANAERQKELQELAVLAADLDNLLSSIKVGTLFLDGDLCIRRFNPAVEYMVELAEDDIGRPIDRFARDLGTDLIGDALLVMRGGESIEREVRAASGSWLLVTIQPYLVQSGGPSGVVVTAVDVTPIKNAQEMTRITNEQLTRANARQREELEDLFSIVAHDLKRPVVALDGLLHLLERADPEMDSGQLVARALTECQRMRRMLEDLSSLSAGTRREFAIEEVDLESWLDALLARYRQTADERNVRLDCICDGGRVRLPRGALEESCVNLLENALNYGCGAEQPCVEVACQLDRGVLELSVQDNGKGIAPENHHKVFEPFRRLDPDMADGSGVGLVAVRRLLGRHGGVISLESEAGHGARFVMRLPVEDDRQARLPIAESRRLLVVEDDVLDAKAIERALGAGFAIVRSKDLAGAVERLSRFRYDAVILDLSLPDGHGLELVRHMRTELQLDTPVVVVTGHGDGLSPTAMTASISGFVAKSELRGDTLRSVVMGSMARNAAPAGEAASRAEVPRCVVRRAS